MSASDFVAKHSPRVLKRTITERNISDDDWKGSDSIRVICRFRPPNKRELAFSQNKGVADVAPRWISEQTVLLNRMKDKSKSKSSNKAFKCTLDHIFESNTAQKQVFYLVGQPMILSTLEGFNSTIFAYGQSGSGKTYTMFGPENDPSNVEHFGLIPRCFIYLFQKLNASLSNNGGKLQEFKVNLELLQIYKRDLLDLLYPQSKVKLIIKTDFRTDTVFVQNLRSVTVHTVEEAFACLTEAQSNRIVAGHALNSVSSRSHMLVCANVMQRHIDGSVVRSKLNFGDLAGSEDLTKALGKNPDPERRKEAIAINSSLSALTTAMSFLSKGKKPGYRDSPLTHILKDSLGGNSKTIMFVACSPHIFNRNETIRALRFAQTAKKVKNKAKKNEEKSVQSLKKRIKELELQVASLEAQVIEARGTKHVLKRVMTRMTITQKQQSINSSRPTAQSICFSDIDDDIDVVDELLKEDGDDEELNYIREISELRRKLEESLESNKELNTNINSKNVELEQCNNQIAQLLQEAQQKLSHVQSVDTALPDIPLPRSRAHTDATYPDLSALRNRETPKSLSVLNGHEKVESVDGNNDMLKYLKNLIVDSQKATTDIGKDSNTKQLNESIKELKKELIEKTQSIEELQKQVTEKVKLKERVNELLEAHESLKNESQYLNEEMDMVTQQKHDLMKKYDDLCKEHEEMKRDLSLKKNENIKYENAEYKELDDDDTNPPTSTGYCGGIYRIFWG